MEEELKKDLERVHRLQKNGGNYGIRVLGRGENLFFQKNDKAFICQIDAVHATVFSKSIKKWDDGTKIVGNEREEVLEALLFLYRKFYNDKVTLIS